MLFKWRNDSFLLQPDRMLNASAIDIESVILFCELMSLKYFNYM